MKLWKHIAGCLTGAALALALTVPAAFALTVEEAITLLEEHYLRELPAEAYEAETLDALFETLGDPYTYYMTAEENQKFVESMEDTSLVGIGVSAQFTPEGILVVDLLDGGAKAAGVLPGDIIVEIDGQSCVPAVETQREWLLGEEGTTVQVTVDRAGERLSFDIVRSLVQILHTNSSLLEEHIGYIDCDSFGTATATHFREAIRNYGEAAEAWLVDLRQNSGGSADGAVDTIGVFGGPGFHLYLRDGAGQLYYYLAREAAEETGRLTVLVDGTSASAAEAFAAAVRDLDLGFLVGQRTYGKGVAQIVLDQTNQPDYFPDGDSLKLTAYRFYSGLGVTNDMVGVIPDLLVDGEHAMAVATAVSREFDMDGEGQLVIMFGEEALSVDTAAVDGATLAALFEALPPQAELYWYCDRHFEDTTLAEVAESLGFTYTSRWFADAADSPYAAQINTLATYGLLTGDEAGEFRPGDTLTRGEVCVLLGKAMDVTGSDRSRFADVAEDDPAAPYINALCDLGWVKGVGDGLFNPGGQLSRQEYFTLLGRMLRFINVNADYTAGQLTAEQLALAEEMGFAAWAREGALLLGADAGEAGAQAPILREEAAYWLYTMLVSGGVLK